ncbi:MAG TPA: UbiA family prenyltransferase [Mycobacteriales bacterium]|nr:UbiA family prenyltransferase [Mycobacteriales bacterium]
MADADGATDRVVERSLSTLWGLVRATHALPSLAVTAFFAATAVAAGVGPRSALLAAAVLVGQASIGWANDYVDAPLDEAAGRRDKPIPTGAVRRGVVGACAGAALIADVPLSLALGWRAGAAHVVAVGSAWHYDLWLKRTPASAVPFAVSFGLVPVIVAAMLPDEPLPRPTLVAAAAACGIAAHFSNTLPDVAADAMTGVRGLPQRLGPTVSTVVAATFVAAASVLLVVATDAAALAVVAAVVDVAAAIVVVIRGRHREQAFRLVIVAVAILVVAFVLSGGHRLTG